MYSYIIEGKDHYLNAESIKSILKEDSFDEGEIHRYDLLERPLDDALEDLDTYSFLTDRKVIIIENPLFLEQAKTPTISDEEYAHLLQYLKNPNPDCCLIFLTTKVNRTLKRGKEVTALTKVVTTNETWKTSWKTQLDGYTIMPDAQKLLFEDCGDNASKFVNECEKLKMYCYDTKKITKEDVEALVMREVTDHEGFAFELTKALLRGDHKKALAIYHDLIDLGQEPIQLLGLIFSQYKTLYQVKALLNAHKTEKEMAELLKAHPYRIQKLKEEVYGYQLGVLKDILLRLAQIDLQVKSTGSDPALSLELFLLETD